MPDLSRPDLGEQEPLLGQPGDASQERQQPLYHNFWLGAGVIAQAGVWILAGIVWGGIFEHDLNLFAAHPLLNSSGIVLLTQGILILQPTHTQQQKKHGTWVHSGLNGVGVLALIGGLVVIAYNKNLQGHGHFESPHAILGLTTYVVMALQAVVGITQYWVPQVYGGIENAKKIWKYHRMSGYVLLALMLATVCASTQTDFVKSVLKVPLWSPLVASVLVMAGTLARVKKQKLGFN